MPIFISYSRADSEFATNLAKQLTHHKAFVWIDQWELHVGDSLIERIQQAIQGASALLVILSKASVESEWCKKELAAALTRELKEKRVVVLPVLKEECVIPLFLQDKLYADFRTNFDDGLRAILESVARVTSENLTRVDAPDWHTDWALDWGTYLESSAMSLTAVEQGVGQPYCVLTEILVTANTAGTERFKALEAADLDWVERVAVIELLCRTAIEQDVRLQLTDERPVTAHFLIQDTSSHAEFRIDIKARRIGQDTGRDVLLDIAGQLTALRDAQKDIHRKLSVAELLRVRHIQSLFSK